MKCPKCGKEMDLYEKDTSSGRMRTYVCRRCEEHADVATAVALWQVLHDARKEAARNRKMSLYSG